MPTRTEQMQGHQVHKTLRNAKDLLESSSGVPSVSEAGNGLRPRFLAVLGLVTSRLEGVDPELIAQSTLNGLNGQVSDALNHYRNFLSNSNPDTANQLNNSLDSVLLQLAQIPILGSPEEVAAVKTGLGAFRRELGQRLSKLKEETQETQRLQAEIRKRVEEQNKAISDQRARLDTLVNEQQSQFAKGEADRGRAFLETQKAADESLRLVLSTQQEKLESLRKDTATTADSLLEEMRKQLESARTIAGVIASTGLAGGFQQTANEHRKAKRFWRGAAAVAMTGFVSFSVAFYLVLIADKAGWSHVLGKSVAIFAFGLAAAWAAKISEWHSREERRTRQLQLELAAFGPYTEMLSEDDRMAVRREMASRFFGESRPSEEQGKKIEQAPSPAVVEIAKMALENLSAFIKKS